MSSHSQRGKLSFEEVTVSKEIHMVLANFCQLDRSLSHLRIQKPNCENGPVSLACVQACRDICLIREGPFFHRGPTPGQVPLNSIKKPSKLWRTSQLT